VLRTVGVDGREHFMSYSNRLVYENGLPAYIRGSARDITERILEKRKFRQMEAWMHQAQKMETVGTLAGGVAHDFNNILTGIMGNIDLVLRKLPADHPVIRHLKIANDAAERAGEITRKLLTFGRKSKPMKVRISLREMIDDVFRLLAETMDRRIAMRNLLGTDLWDIQADRAQMLQLVMNLCLNAQDALLEKRDLTISSTPGQAIDLSITVMGENISQRKNKTANFPRGKSGDFVRLSIADTGCGMDKRTQERIFEPFFTTKQLNKGTGLGLSTVYGIVQQHDGWISVDSQISQGTTFDIFLPADHRGAGSQPSKKSSCASPLDWEPRETILVADDEAFIRDYCSEALSEAGYRVILAPDGKAALELFDRHQENIDLLILDLVMPHYSGREVMEQIIIQRPGTKIILSSGYSSELIGSREQIKGHRAILPKPYSTEELIATVRAALD
jgi:signal transduction histidine kinase